MELEAWTVRQLHKPHVQVFMFSGLEVDDVVTVMEFGGLVKLVYAFFQPDLRLLLAMRHETMEVQDKMAVAVGDTSQRHQQNPLTVDMGLGRLFGGVRRKRLVNRRHFLRGYDSMGNGADEKLVKKNGYPVVGNEMGRNRRGADETEGGSEHRRF